MRNLRQSLVILAASFILCLCVARTDAAPPKSPIPLPPGALSATEVTALFSDRTVESLTAVRGRVSKSYYDPSGEVRQIRNGQTRKGRWRVSKGGRVCLQMEDRPEKCRIIVKEGAEYKKYIVKKNGMHQHSVTYRQFWDGNPFDL